MNGEHFGGLGGRTHRGEVEDERHHGEESRDKSRLDTDYVDGKTVNGLKAGAIDVCHSLRIILLIKLSVTVIPVL